MSVGLLTQNVLVGWRGNRVLIRGLYAYAPWPRGPLSSKVRWRPLEIDGESEENMMTWHENRRREKSRPGVRALDGLEAPCTRSKAGKLGRRRS